MIKNLLLLALLLLLNGCQSLTGSSSQSSNRGDDDNDGIINLFDVDDDGDGLIEINDAEGLSGIRFMPDGSGYKASPSAATNRKGCGGADGRDECEGYELTADVNLKYASAWQSIGLNFFHQDALQVGRPFTATLDGNGHSISNMRFNEPLFKAQHQGLFSHTKGATIKNLRMVGVDLRAGQSAGAVVGYAEYTNFDSVEVSDSSIKGKEATGGLIGYAEFVQISASRVVDSKIDGEEKTGGLIGEGRGTKIVASYAEANRISGLNSLGGLAGAGYELSIFSSYSLDQRMKSRVLMGGLVGRDQAGDIRFSYAANQYDGIEAGGLMGEWDNASVSLSYWDADSSRDDDDGQALTKQALTQPTDFSGPYAGWLAGEPNAIWCDTNQNGRIDEAEQRDDNRIWHFGDTSQYPRIRCGLPRDDE